MTVDGRLWIALADGLLAKVEVIVEGRTCEGEQFRMLMEQVFADYNGAISIRAPG